MAKKQTRNSLSIRRELYLAAQAFYPTVNDISLSSYVTRLILKDLEKNGIKVELPTLAPKPAKSAPAKTVASPTELIGDLRELAKLTSKVSDLRDQVTTAEAEPVDPPVPPPVETKPVEPPQVVTKPPEPVQVKAKPAEPTQVVTKPPEPVQIVTKPPEPPKIEAPRIDIPGPPPKWRESSSSLGQYSDLLGGDFQSPGQLPPAKAPEFAPINTCAITALQIDEIPVLSESDRAQLPESPTSNLFPPTEPSNDPPALQVVPEPIVVNPPIVEDCTVPIQQEEKVDPKPPEKKKKVKRAPKPPKKKIQYFKPLEDEKDEKDPDPRERNGWTRPPKHLAPETLSKVTNDDFGGGMVFSTSLLDEPEPSGSRYGDISRADLDDLVGDITKDTDGNSLLGERAEPKPPKKQHVSLIDSIPGPPEVPTLPREEVPLTLWVCNGVYIAAQNFEQAQKYTANSTRSIRENVTPELYEGVPYNRECLVPGVLPADELRAVFEKKEPTVS